MHWLRAVRARPQAARVVQPAWRADSPHAVAAVLQVRRAQARWPVPLRGERDAAAALHGAVLQAAQQVSIRVRDAPLAHAAAPKQLALRGPLQPGAAQA
jgi:hypothetical protein